MFAMTGGTAWNSGIRRDISFSSIRLPPWPMPSRAVRRRGNLPRWSICSPVSLREPRPPEFAAPTFSTWPPQALESCRRRLDEALRRDRKPARGDRPAARRAVVGDGGADPRRIAFRSAAVGESPLGPGHLAVGIQSLLARAATLPGHRRPGLRGAALSCADAGPTCSLGRGRRCSNMAEASPQPAIAAASRPGGGRRFRRHATSPRGRRAGRLRGRGRPAQGLGLRRDSRNRGERGRLESGCPLIAGPRRPHRPAGPAAHRLVHPLVLRNPAACHGWAFCFFG